MNDKVGVYQKIFYSTTKYVILKNAFLVTAGVLSIFIVRFLSPQEYGKWALVYQLIATIGGIVNFGLLPTLAKFIPEYQNIEKKNELFSQAFLIILLVFFIFLFFYFIGINLFHQIIPKEIKDVKYLFCIFVGSLSLINVIEGFYRGLGKFNQWTIIEGSRSVLSAGLAIFFVLFVSAQYKPVFYTYFLIIILYLVVLLLSLRKNLNLNVSINLERQIIKFSLIMLIGQVVFLFKTSIDSVLLRALLKDPTQVGYYNAGIRIPKMLQTMFIAPLSVPFLYYFSYPKTSESRKRIIEFGMKMIGIICGGFSLFLFSFAKEITILFFGHGYLESIPVLRIFSLVLFFLGITVFFTPYFYSISKPSIPLVLSIFSMLLCFVFSMLLIPHLKCIGSTISILLGLFLQTLAVLYLFGKQNIKCFKNFIMLFFCLTVAVLAGIYIKYSISLPVFIIFIILTRSFSLEDMEIWKKVITRSSLE